VRPRPFHYGEERQPRFCHAIDNYAQRFIGIGELWIAPDYIGQPVSVALLNYLLYLMPRNNTNQLLVMIDHRIQALPALMLPVMQR
jgi:hypothetical protein